MSERSLTPTERQFSMQLAEKSKAIESVLPEHITPRRFMRICATAVQKNRNLLGLDRESLLEACLFCAQDGLLPDGREAALVPFGQKVTYMPMVSGILKKIRQSGELKSLMAECVYANESFDYYTDMEGPHLNHVPLMSGDRGSFMAVYAVAKTKDDGIYHVVMRKEDVESIRSISKTGSSTSSPWNKFFSEMAKKTAIRRLSKIMPMSTDVERVVQRDDDMYSFQPKNVTPVNNAMESASEHILQSESKLDEVLKEDN